MQATGNRLMGMLAAACAAFLLTACEGIFTGTEAETRPLEADAGGGYQPVTLQLTVEMSPVALNFRAEQGNHPHEMNRWNAYQASLSRGGQVVASRDFNVNYTGTVDMSPAHPELVVTMLTHRVAESGEYTLVIRPLKPAEVTLQNPRLEVRRNVQLPQ